MNPASARPVGVLASLYRQRGLLAVLVGRELKARYRGTFLGYLWSLLNPLLLLGVYTAVFTFVIPARAPSSDHSAISTAPVSEAGTMPMR